MERNKKTEILVNPENIALSAQSPSPNLHNMFSLQSSFVGREHELETIEQRFKDPSCHLLTLVGLGGVGKTRIAYEVAAHSTLVFADGRYFVPLAQVSSPDLVANTLAASIGLFLHGHESPRIQLIRYLLRCELLLVLDNFEHLIGEADLITEILREAPDVRLLVTSRERLNVQEEWVLDIDALDYPQDELTDSIDQYPAIQLFLKCARQIKADFQLTASNQSAVIRICRLVEGLPLGIELAASWIRVLSCQAISDEIERNLGFLTSPLRNTSGKHRSMRAVFEQSYNLLTGEQQQVFRYLSVFRGGFMRGATGASLNTLSALMDKSCLRCDPNGRYDLHELLRQYAGEKLIEAGEAERAHDTHCAYYAQFMDSRVDDLRGRRQIEALAEITADFENVRAAWIWAIKHKQTENIENMLEGLWLFCNMRNREQEGASLFRFGTHAFSEEKRFERLWGRLIARGGGEPEIIQMQHDRALQIARHYDDVGEIAFCLQKISDIVGDQVKTKQLLEQSLAYYRHLEDHYGVAETLFKLMSNLMHSNYEGVWDEFIRYGEESLHLRREIGDQVGIAWSTAPVAHGAAREGRFVEAEELWQERIAVGQKLGATSLVAMGHAHLSYQVYFPQGDFVKAQMAAKEGMRIGRDTGFLNAVGFGLTTLGLLASMEENYEQGQILCQQAATSTSVAWVIRMSAWGSAIAACGLGDYQTVKTSFPLALAHLIHMFGSVGILGSLPIATILLAQRGDQIRATELLALAFTHRISTSGWIKKWPLLNRLYLQLEQSLGYEAFTKAWERGKLLDLNDVSAELLQQFPRKSILSTDKINLSERELEVLRLVAEGCSNQDIADRLYVGVSTVKKHINHIYDKLEVKNRTQAVAIARKQQLLTL